MKKTILAIAMFCMALTVNAQTLIKGNYQKGDTAVYVTTAKMEVSSPMAGSGSMTANATCETRYAVQDATADGFVIECLVTKVDITGDIDQLPGSMIEAQKMILNTPVIFSTDANGKPVKIVNLEEVKAKETEATKKMIDDLYAANPQMEQMRPKEAMLGTLTENITEESILSQLESFGLFDMNGATLKSGDTDERMKEGVKVQNSYTVTPILGTTVVVQKSTSNMSEDEVKDFVINKMTESGVSAEQIEMVKQNWQQFAAMGFSSLNLDGTTTYRFLKSGWAQDSTSNMTLKAMGVETKVEMTTKLAQKNF